MTTESGLAAAITSPDAEPPEPCPTPLAWEQVLAAFRNQSRPFTCQRAGYLISGRQWGMGPPLYFLGGLTGDHELFSLTAWLLRDHFRCVLYDYPSVSGRLHPVDWADDLMAVADSLNDNCFSIVATSLGGIPALTGMRSYPQRIERAVLQGAFAYRRLRLAERTLIRVCLQLPGSIGSLPFRRKIHTANHRSWFPPWDHTRWQFFEDNTGRTSIRAAAQRAKAVQVFDARPWLKEVQAPVMLIRGEGEGLVTSNCLDELETGLVDCRSEPLHTTGHVPWLTHPHRFAGLVRDFLLESDS